MGRKIPGRKHRGVRDPEKQQAVRFERIKDKINTPPTDPDFQDVPKSALKLAELQQKTKDGLFKRKKKEKKQIVHKFKQKRGESDGVFLHRIHQHCMELKREAEFEEKFNVEVKRNEKGEISSIDKRAPDPVNTMLKEIRKGKKKGAKGQEKPEEKITKSQKRKLKALEKKQAKAEEPIKDFDSLKDVVKFGEQVHGPPVLTIPKKSSNIPNNVTKNLLLTSILEGPKLGPKVDKKSQKIDKKGKRKDLPHALRRQLDKQQLEVIQAYRQMKATRSNKA